MRKSRPVVAALDLEWTPLDVERRTLAAIDADLEEHSCRTEDDVIAVAANASAILTESAPLSARVIDSLSGCQVISKLGVGVDNIDLAAAAARGIVVTHVPDYCTDEVADHTVALALAVLRRIVPTHERIRDGDWPSLTGAPIPGLRGSAWGLLGCGRTGLAVAARAAAFGCRLLGHDPAIDDATIASHGIHPVSLDQLLTGADVVSLHATYIRGARPTIGEAELRHIKPSAILVNTARGQLIDEPALHRALDAGTIAGAGLDVRSQEPPPINDPLRSHPRVLLTSHTAWYSTSAVAELRQRGSTAIVDVLSGRQPQDQINFR